MGNSAFGSDDAQIGPDGRATLDLPACTLDNCLVNPNGTLQDPAAPPTYSRRGTYTVSHRERNEFVVSFTEAKREP
jgi:hypothetical protein